MELEEYERSLNALCFAAQSGEAMPGFLLYRELVRSRFVAMAKVAFRRSYELAEEPLARCFDRYLEERPPRTPILREVIAGFAQFACEDRALSVEAPCVSDVLTFEAAVWNAAQRSEGVLADLEEVDFERVLAVNPTLHVLHLRHEVIDLAGRDATAVRPCENVLLVYRRPGEDAVRWYRTGGLMALLLESAQRECRPFAELVRFALERRAETCDAELLDELAHEMALAVERGVVLGSLAAPRALDKNERSL